MKESTSCPHCGTSFNVARVNEGKRAKCPKCQEGFTIQFPSANPEDAVFNQPPSEPPIVPPAVPNTISLPTVITSKAITKRPANSKSVTIPMWAMLTIPPILMLIVGYFAGREHLKYEIRTSLQGAAAAFSKGLENRPLGNSTSGAASPSVKRSGAASNDSSPANEQTKQFALGDTVQEDGFTIRLKSASIDTPDLKNMMGQSTRGKDPVMILSFDLKNTDERRILRFKEDNPFMGSHFRMRDDVNNVIRGITYGIGSKPKGALSGSDDIAPGATASHVELFSVPPPKTQFLILTIDLACLGGDGEIEYKIPVNAIRQ